MAFFKDLPNQPNFDEQELAVLKWWQENDVLNQYLHKNDQSENFLLLTAL